MEGKLRCQGWERRNGKEGKRYVDTVGSWERWNREGEGTMGRIGKRERKWKVECFGLERGKERREWEGGWNWKERGKKGRNKVESWEC